MRSLYIDCTGDLAGRMDAAMQALLPGLEVNRSDPSPEELPSLLAGCAGVLNGHTYMAAELLTELPALKAIVFLGTGAATYIDIEAAAAAGVRVLNVPGYGDRTIAEHTIGLMFAAVREIAGMDRRLRRGEWYPRLGRFELEGKTFGIIGLGGIGRQVAMMAAALGMRVLAWNRSGVPAGIPAEAAESIDRVAAASDVLSLHVAETPETRGLLDRRRIGLMRPGAILVNTARAGLVDQAAMLESLRSGCLAHAALDVYPTEPIAPDDPLLELDNVTLTPHTAWISPEASTRLLRRGIETLRDALAELS
jgi:D-3-phosphoglycerate dehydrogenase / 2-oxoglutarate reductase